MMFKPNSDSSTVLNNEQISWKPYSSTTRIMYSTLASLTIAVMTFFSLNLAKL